MRPFVCRIADGLWQSAFVDAQRWIGAAKHVDLTVYMAGESPPLYEGVEHINYPIADNADGCTCLDAVRALAREVAGRRVLTICHAGENRSGLLSALILVERGMAPDEAVALVQANGSHNSPTQPHSFWNPGFVRQILEIT